MHPTRSPRVKICCIASVEEARVAVHFGASALGLVSEMPSGPGVISEELIAEIAVTIPPSVSSFLLTSKQDARSIIDQQKRCRVNTVQICDRLEIGSYSQLRRAMPGISLVQVVHVTGEEAIEKALSVAPHVDAILLDSGNQSLAVKELGGTGRVHDWSISRRIRQEIRVPLFLAGGLKAENIREAIAEVQPFGVDICSGVRSDGKLDERKLAAFFEEIERGGRGSLAAQ
ncbi:MAG: phosphoribosylanthranilate isomerase [Acidobacteriota bacterium]